MAHVELTQLPERLKAKGWTIGHVRGGSYPEGDVLCSPDGLMTLWIEDGEVVIGNSSAFKVGVYDPNVFDFLCAVRTAVGLDAGRASKQGTEDSSVIVQLGRGGRRERRRTQPNPPVHPTALTGGEVKGVLAARTPHDGA